MSPALAQALLTLALLVIFVGFLLWGIKTGQFRNIEGPKYRIFDDDEEEEKEKMKVEENVKSKEDSR